MPGMVKSRRLRSIVTSLLLYVVTAGLSSYFIYSAVFGARGLKARDRYQAEMGQLAKQSAALANEQAAWRHRVMLIRSGVIDADLLDNEARSVLGLVAKDEVVVLLPKVATNRN